ncbi:DUF2225 domain-containing protein [Desulforamulus ruminis]|uniref:DUF2225 domain-containing protein n=1 Tax=Desulforamulus ruminis (strain ATCC 23193 / DSM 2154 / NCIMB 8452 / DL) TaxID=696281 RepID=F6DPP3_DESRL|nr:DUF2225 domain-containing protein [Desulforamulus ruminis]AEG59620.1 Protein of unknown function DUF2225 [Desulforamulus ruminis DSM 2154]
MQVTEEMIFFAKCTCPNCGKEFEHPEVRSKFVSLEKQDSDFCGYYNNINPVYYQVAVCKHCGYAYTKSSSSPLGEYEKAAVHSILSNWHRDSHQYGGLRTLEQAVKSYKLAILCQELRKAKDSVMGSLYLSLAWLYRYQCRQEEETQALQRAFEFMKRAYERETASELKQELKLMYVLGDLAYRLGNNNEAVQWFYAVTTHEGADQYPVFSRMARSRWQEIREEIKQNRE